MTGDMFLRLKDELSSPVHDAHTRTAIGRGALNSPSNVRTQGRENASDEASRSLPLYVSNNSRR